MVNIPTTNPTKNDYEYWRNKPSNYKVITKATTVATDTVVKVTDGLLTGFFVSSVGGAGTMKIWDYGSGTGTILIDTFTPVAGNYIMSDVLFGTALTVTMGNTATVTIFYK